jgi:hypothetical protein
MLYLAETATHQGIQASSGGPLSKQAGDDLVASGVKLLSVYAGTEFGCPVYGFYSKNGENGDIRTPEDWEYLQFRTDYVHPRMIPQGDGTYELQLLVSC